MRNATILLTCFILLTFFQKAASAQGTRNAVLVEIFTGTWCVFCPSMAVGADMLVNSGADVAIVENHWGDTWVTQDAFLRTVYYDITGYPTTYFDGHDSIFGAGSIYDMNPRYLAAIAAPTPFNLTGSWTQGSGSVDVTVNIEQVGAYSPGNLILHTVVTESLIPTNWFSMYEINFVNRAMIPNSEGTHITTTMGGTTTRNFNIPIDSAWNQSEMQVVMWVQDSASKTVYNTVMMPLSIAAHTIDATALHLDNNISQSTCTTSFQPKVRIRNNGSTDLTSVDIQYSVNGGAVQTLPWTGNLQYHCYEDVILPVVNFTPVTLNDLTVTLVNPNQTTDPAPSDNTIFEIWAIDNRPNGLYHLELQLDQYGEETAWNFQNSAGTVVASNAAYPNSFPNMGPLISEDIDLSVPDCYTFTITDYNLNGICCANGNGSFTLTDPSGATVISGSNFGLILTTGWKSVTVSSETELAASVSVYPNPATGVFNVEFGTGLSGMAEISVVNLSGKMVYETLSTQSFTRLDLSALSEGMYMVNIKTDKGIAVKKIIIE